MFYILCLTFCVLHFVFYILCLTFCVLHFVFYTLCSTFLFPVFHELMVRNVHLTLTVYSDVRDGAVGHS